MLRRRDQTVRSLRVEHYSSAVNRLLHGNRQLPNDGHTVTDSPSYSIRHSLRPNGRLISVPQPQAHRCSVSRFFTDM